MVLISICQPSVVAGLVSAYYRDQPLEHSGVNRRETRSNRPRGWSRRQTGSQRACGRRIVRSPRSLVSEQHVFCYGWVAAGCDLVYGLPTYLSRLRHFSPTGDSVGASLPLLAATVTTSPVAGSQTSSPVDGGICGAAAWRFR